MMFLGKFQERECGFCDNKISKWRAVWGVLNCNDCVWRMQMGQPPRCRKTNCHKTGHGHPSIGPMAA